MAYVISSHKDIGVGNFKKEISSKWTEDFIKLEQNYT